MLPDFPESLKNYLRTPRTLNSIARKLGIPKSVARDRMLVLIDAGFVISVPMRDFRTRNKYQLSRDGVLR